HGRDGMDRRRIEDERDGAACALLPLDQRGKEAGAVRIRAVGKFHSRRFASATACIEELSMSWLSRFRNAVSPQRLDEDLGEEMRDHLQRRIAALRESGLSADEAERQARLSYGNTTRLREESRDFRLWTGLEGTLQ